MKKLLNILLYLPMPVMGIGYGIYFSIPGDSDTVPFASMLTGIILVALPMMILSIFNIAMFLANCKCGKADKKVRRHTLIGGMISPVLAFLWLFIMSNFNVYLVTGVYVFVSLISGTILLVLNAKKVYC